MCVSDLVASFLQLGILASLKMLIHFFLVTSILDAKIYNLLGRLCVGKVQSRGAIELDILSWEVLSNIKHLTLDIEDFNA